MTGSSTRSAADAVAAAVRLESARLIAGLARYTGEVGLAEDLAQDAVVAALEQWPSQGVPANPGAWLMTVAKRRAIDLFRRNDRLRDKYAELGRAASRRAGSHAGLRRGLRRGHRRRPAAAGVHLLPPGARHAGPGRADPAAARRPEHRRDRPGLPGRRADHRAADRPGQEDAWPAARVPFEVPPPDRAHRAALPRCSRFST